MKDELLKIAEAFEALEARIAAQDERIATLEERLEAQQQRIEEMENAEPEVEVELVPMPVEDEPEPVVEPKPVAEFEPEPEIPAEPEVPEEPEPVEETPVEEPVAEPEPEPEPVVAPEPARPVQTSLFGPAVEDIRHAISLGDRFLFQRELFAGNGELMQKTLDSINGLHSFEEAEQYIQRFGWEHDSPAYDQFVNVLHRRF